MDSSMGISKHHFTPLTLYACSYVQCNFKFSLSTAAMAENGRLVSLNNVINAFGRLMAAHRGEVICTVTTAKVYIYIYIVDLLSHSSVVRA